MTWTAIADSYNRDVRRHRAIERAGLAAKIVLAIALALGLAIGATAAVTEIVATRAAATATPWRG